METIIASVISATGAVIVCMINSSHQAKTTRNLIEYKIEELTKRVDKHNNVVERTYRLEENQAVMQEQLKVANHRIADLEKEN